MKLEEEIARLEAEKQYQATKGNVLHPSVEKRLAKLKNEVKK